MNAMGPRCPGMHAMVITLKAKRRHFNCEKLACDIATVSNRCDSGHNCSSRNSCNYCGRKRVETRCRYTGALVHPGPAKDVFDGPFGPFQTTVHYIYANRRRFNVSGQHSAMLHTKQPPGPNSLSNSTDLLQNAPCNLLAELSHVENSTIASNQQVRESGRER